MERLVGRVPARPGRSGPRAQRRGAHHGRRPRAAGGLHARPRLASRQLLRPVEPHRVRRRHGRDPPRRRQLHPAAHAAARHRPRGVADERGSDPRLGSGHAVPHALRSLPRRPPALPGADGSARRVEPDRHGGCSATRHWTTPSASARSSRRRCSTSGGRSGSRKPSSTTAPAGSTIRGRDCPGTGRRTQSLIPDPRSEFRSDSRSALGTPLV